MSVCCKVKVKYFGRWYEFPYVNNVSMPPAVQTFADKDSFLTYVAQHYSTHNDFKVLLPHVENGAYDDELFHDTCFKLNVV